MEAGDELPANSTTLRLAKASETPSGQPPTQAFYLRRERAEKDISLGWLDFFLELPAEQRMTACLAVMTQDYSPKNSAKVLIVDIDRARDLLGSDNGLKAVKFVYSPEINVNGRYDNLCHASIEGMADLSEALYQAAAQQVAMAVTAIHDWARVKPR
jgi:hypothetical protein